MSDVSTKPVIFISFSHRDEPEKPSPGEMAWLTFVQSFLAPVVKAGIFELWTDERLHGGDEIDPEIARKLAGCDIFVLLVSRHSLASAYVVDKEITTIKARQADGQNVRVFPIVLSPFPKVALGQIDGHLLRPQNGAPLSLMSENDREVAMAGIADEIALVATEAVARKVDTVERLVQVANDATLESLETDRTSPTSVDISHLPETPYERLVGRDAELQRLDQAWSDPNINVISLIAEGGAGKSALVNEWLGRMSADGYRGANAVLGWSFYSQGARERAASADQFLNWAIEKLGIKLETASATAKGEAIAEIINKRRILMVLDGCEPLQHGFDEQQAELKDQGLRALLRRVSAMPPNDVHGQIVLTSRLAVKDIDRWTKNGAPIVDVSALSDEAGAVLLRDNGVWGTDKELLKASHDFGGHALALGLLASYLKVRHVGDVRARNHIRSLLGDWENPRHDQARRVMESYEDQWLKNRPLETAIMNLIGLFDRPASPDCVGVLRRKPAISGLTESIVSASEDEWRKAVAQLRATRLLSPLDRLSPETLDAHPLVREWFGTRLREKDEGVWKAAHAKLYEHLLKSTPKKKAPSFNDLAPLYQAITHGCKAELFERAFSDVYIKRLCRIDRNGEYEFYSYLRLGAIGADLSAIGWFFEKPYVKVQRSLPEADESWLLCEAAGYLRAQGRLTEALNCYRAGVRFDERGRDWANSSVTANNLAETLLLMGDIEASIGAARKSVRHADRTRNAALKLEVRATLGNSLSALGRANAAKAQFQDVDHRTKRLKLEVLSPVAGYYVRDFLLGERQFEVVMDLSFSSLECSKADENLFKIGLDAVTIGRAHLGLALSCMALSDRCAAVAHCQDAQKYFGFAYDQLLASGQREGLACGILARACLHRLTADRDAAKRDLDEVEEIGEPARMKPLLCDVALGRSRLAFARIEVFAPLNGLIEVRPPAPVVPDEAEIARLKDEAARQVAVAADYIKTCGYHRRDEELAELQAVLRGERKFADLPPRV